MKKSLFMFTTIINIIFLIGCQANKNTQSNFNSYCSFTISCESLVNNDTLPEEKKNLVPENGIIFSYDNVGFNTGESAFDVLKRICLNEKIHFEFSETVGLGSMYIEGIGNLYEFDAGELSGWLYKVNNIIPSVSCSDYILSENDEVLFFYTCDMGAELGF